jgi:hypothetical protein
MSKPKLDSEWNVTWADPGTNKVYRLWREEITVDDLRNKDFQKSLAGSIANFVVSWYNGLITKIELCSSNKILKV